MRLNHYETIALIKIYFSEVLNLFLSANKSTQLKKYYFRFLTFFNTLVFTVTGYLALSSSIHCFSNSFW